MTAPLTLHRSRLVVAAIPQADGSVLVIDGGQELQLPAAEFQRRYAPASIEDMRAIATHAPTGDEDVKALPAPASPSAATRGRKLAQEIQGPKSGHTSKPAPQELHDFARGLFEGGASAKEIASAVTKKGRQTSVATIYGWSSTQNWKRKPKAVVATPAPSKPTSGPTRTEPRRCEECGQQTNQDPCGNCGTRWKR